MYGLAQLHQLRGRVGRGKVESTCILLLDRNKKTAFKRMEIMKNSTDGFYIAEKDLQLRGPGDILGTNQSGIQSEIDIISMENNKLFEEARQDVDKIISDDPRLEKEENSILKGEIIKSMDVDFLKD